MSDQRVSRAHRRTRKPVAFLLVLILVIQAFAPAGWFPFGKVEEASAATTRETIQLPNSTYYNLFYDTATPASGALFTWTSADQNNEIFDNTRSANQVYMTQQTADQTMITSTAPFPIFAKNLDVQLNMSFGSNTSGLNFLNRGMAVVFHPNGVTQPIGGGGYGDYSRLGVYGYSWKGGFYANAGPIPNALAVEFDMSAQGSDFDQEGAYWDGPGSVNAPHIAITRPISATSANRLVHNATSSYAMNDGRLHRVGISWKHTSSGADGQENTADDQYTLTYKIYSSANPLPSDQPTTRSMTYTKAEALSLFGGKDQLYLSITGSNSYNYYGSTDMTVAFPSTAAYTVRYYIKQPDGTLTTTKVPGLITNYPATGGTGNPVSGQAAVGPYDLGELPLAPTGYRLVEGQTTKVAIQSTAAQNVFTYYYTPTSAPVKVNYYVEDMSKPATTKTYQKYYTDTSLSGYIGDTANARPFATILDEMVAAGMISPETAAIYKTGFALNSATSVTSGIITADDPATPADEGLTLNLYMDGRRDVPYTVKYLLQGTETVLSSPYDGTGGVITQMVDLAGISGVVKTIPGYTRTTTDLTLAINSTTGNVKVLEYSANSDTPYQVRHDIQMFDADNQPSWGLVQTDDNTGTTGSSVTATPLARAGYRYDSTQSTPTGIVSAESPLTLTMRYTATDQPYRIEHYTVDSRGAATLYRTADGGDRPTGSYVTAAPLTIAGYSYAAGYAAGANVEKKTGQVVAVADSAIDPTVDPFDGLTLKLYYTANTDIPVTVKYELTDGTRLAPDGAYTGTMGDTLAIPALTIQGYVPQTANLDHVVQAADNVATILYDPASNVQYRVQFYKGSTLVATDTYHNGVTGNIVTLDQQTGITPMQGGPYDFTGYEFNLNASTLSGKVAPDGSLVLSVYYMASGGIAYTMQYFLQNPNGGWPATPFEILTGHGTTGTAATFLVHPIAGYTFDQANTSTINILTGVIAGDGSTVLKGAYLANSDTAYTVECYRQTAIGSTVYARQISEVKHGTTGATVDTSAPPEMAGYELNGGKTVIVSGSPEAAAATIAGDGSTIVRYYYDLKDLTVNVRYYVADGKLIYPEAASATTSMTARVGEKITPPALTDASVVPADGAMAADYYRGYLGYAIDPDRSDVIPFTVGAENPTIHVYYRPLHGRAYQVQHYAYDMTTKSYVHKAAFDSTQTDGVSHAAIDLADEWLDGSQLPGYTPEPAKTDATAAGAIYAMAGQPIEYPNVATDPRLVVRLYYQPNTDTSYIVRFQVPDSTSESGYRTAIIQSKTGTTSALVTAFPLTTFDDVRLTGYVFDSSHPNNIGAANLSPNGDTVLQFFYKPAANTPYRIDYFLSRTDGTYDLAASVRDARTGVTGATAYATDSGAAEGTLRNFAGYEYDTAASDNLQSATILPDGSTVLKRYYRAKADTPYTVRVWSLVHGGYVERVDLRQTLTGTSGSYVTIDPASIAMSGYTLNRTISVLGGYLDGNGGSVFNVYYDPNTHTPYKVEIYLQREGAYPEQASLSETYTGVTGETVTTSIRSLVGYTFDSNAPNVLSETLAGNGSTVLKLHYTANTVAYAIHYVVKIVKTVDGNDQVTYQEVAESVTGSGAVGSTIDAATSAPKTVVGYLTPAAETFTLGGSSNQFYYLYEADPTQKFDYQINYYRLVPGTAGDSYVSVPVPGIASNPVTGSAPVGTDVAIEHIASGGYKLASNQPTHLIVKNQNANPTLAESTLAQKKSNNPSPNVVNIFYIVNLDESFPYQINYFIAKKQADDTYEYTQTPVPGVSPNPIGGQMSVEQVATVYHPTLTTGYHILPDQPTSMRIVSGDGDPGTPGNQLALVNTRNVYYEVDPAQWFRYSINQYKLVKQADNSYKKTTTPLPGTATTSGTANVAAEIDLTHLTIPAGYRLATKAELGQEQEQPDKLVVTGDNLAKIDLYYVIDEAQPIDYTVHYYIVGTDRPVPGIIQSGEGSNATPSGSAAVESVVSLLRPTLATGYKIAAYQPESLTVTSDPAHNVAVMNYAVDFNQQFPYTIAYYYLDGEGHEKLVGAFTPNPITGTGVVEQQIPINKPVITGYKPVDASPQTLVIDGTNPANQQVRVQYVKDDSQFATYTVQHIANDGPAAAVNGGVMKTETVEALKDTTVQASPEYFAGYLYTTTNSHLSGKNDGTLVLKLYYNASAAISYTVRYLTADGTGLEEAVIRTNAAWADQTAVKEESAPAIAGYRIIGWKLTQGATVTDGEISEVSAANPITFKLAGTTSNILDILYAPDEYAYEVHYLLASDETTPVATAKTGTAAYGAYIVEQAQPVVGYNVIGSNSKTLVVGSAPAANRISFNYLPRSDIGYTVHYLQQGTETLLAAEKVGVGTYGQASPTEYPIAIAGYTPVSGGGKTVMLNSVNAAENVITLDYTANTDIGYTVRYLDGNGDAIAQPKVVNGRTMGETVNETAPGVTGYLLPADPTQELTLKAADNVITFVYPPGPSSYHVEYHFQQPGGGYQIDDAKTETISATTGDQVSLTPPSQPGYTFHADASKLGGSVLADGSLVLKIYYNVTLDNGYVVHYVDQAGSSIAPDKSVSHLPYGATVTESAPAIPHYIKPTDDSREVVVGTTAEMTFTYTGEDVSYNVFYRNESGQTLSPTIIGFGRVGDTVEPVPPSINGYRLPATRTLTLKATGNDLVYTYVADDSQAFSYVIHYYIAGTATQVPGIVQGGADGNATPSGSAEVGTVISLLKPSPLASGYRVAANQPESLTVTNDTAKNQATIYYEIDSGQTFEYSIHYYLMTATGETTTTPVPGIMPNPVKGAGVLGQTVAIVPPTLTNGYLLAASQPTSLVLTGDPAQNAAVVYYRPDPEQTLTYQVQYYVDGVRKTEWTETGLTVPKADPVVRSVADHLAEMTDACIDPVASTDLPYTVRADGDVIKVFYVRTTIPYVVNYYEDGVYKSTLAGTVPDTHPVVVDLAIDAPTGYKVGSVRLNEEELAAPYVPATISMNRNTFTVAYVKDPDKVVHYTVQYWNGTDDTEITVRELTVPLANPIVVSVNTAEALPTGYVFDSLKSGDDPFETGTAVAEGQVLRVTYVQNAEDRIAYDVFYYQGTQLASVATATVTQASPQVTGVEDRTPLGYRLDAGQSTALPFSVTNTAKTINVYYVPDSEQTFKYEIRYLVAGTDAPVPGLDTVKGEAAVGEEISIDRPAVTDYKVLSNQPLKLVVQAPEPTEAIVYYASTKSTEQPTTLRVDQPTAGTKTISGVTDPGATVIVRLPGGETVEATADSSGLFRATVPALTKGQTIVVEASLPGKQTASVQTSVAAAPSPGGGGGGGGGVVAPPPVVTPPPAEGSHSTYIHGYPDGTFRPTHPITRAEVAAIMMRIDLGYEIKEATSTYRDVPAGAWYAKAVAYAQTKGFLSGYPDGTFRPMEEISRAEVASLIARYKALKLNEAQTGTGDCAGHWAAQAVEAVKLAGVVAGYPDGTFRPDKEITRAEFVAMINRMLGRTVDKGYVDENAIHPFTDVRPSNWAYYDIIEAAVYHKFDGKDGGETWRSLT